MCYVCIPQYPLCLSLCLTLLPFQDIDRMEYHGGQIAANCFLNLNYEKDVTILDIGAGTGIIGKILHNNGYRNIDALDANETMLEELRQKNCYRNVFNSQVTPDTKLPFEKQTYDVVILAGVFCPGHIQVKSLEQIIPIVKSGNGSQRPKRHSNIMFFSFRITSLRWIDLLVDGTAENLRR